MTNEIPKGFRDKLWITNLDDVSVFEWCDLPDGVTQESYTRTDILAAKNKTIREHDLQGAQDDYNWDSQQAENNRQAGVIRDMLEVLEAFVSAPMSEGKMKLEHKIIKVIAKAKSTQIEEAQ